MTVAARPTIPAERYADRLDRARASLAAHGAAALLIGVGADLRYLTGYVAMPLERLTMLVLATDGPAVLLAPRPGAMAAAGPPAPAAGARCGPPGGGEGGPPPPPAPPPGGPVAARPRRPAGPR